MRNLVLLFNERVNQGTSCADQETVASRFVSWRSVPHESRGVWFTQFELSFVAVGSMRTFSAF